MGLAARGAAAILAQAPTAQKAAALREAAAVLRASAAAVLAANAADMARAIDLSPAMRDRLRLDDARLEGIAAEAQKAQGQADVALPQTATDARLLMLLAVALGLAGLFTLRGKREMA